MNVCIAACAPSVQLLLGEYQVNMGTGLEHPSLGPNSPVVSIDQAVHQATTASASSIARMAPCDFSLSTSMLYIHDIRRFSYRPDLANGVTL